MESEHERSYQANNGGSERTLEIGSRTCSEPGACGSGEPRTGLILAEVAEFRPEPWPWEGLRTTFVSGGGVSGYNHEA